MAKTISDEKMKFSIVIDGNEAQKELLDLEKSTRELTKSNKDLLFQKKALEAQGKKDTAEYKALTAEIKNNTVSINGNKTKMKELQDQIGLTGLTMKQLSDKAMVLRMALRNSIPGGEAFQRYTAELGEVNTRISELSGRANTARFSIGGLADGFSRYAALGASVIAGLTGVVVSIQSIIDLNGKLSDSQADVMKTTGMTKKEVEELTRSFGLLQTRTSRIDLLKIAESGGRIGIAKTEISSFVEVMNKAAVALGDSFTGGAEEVADKLGKLKFLFKETQELNVDQAYNSIGSAINDLGANGSATESNIADFTTRIGSLTDALKPTIAETLALGAAFEESGIESEVSSRAYNIFMKQASTESGKFAKVMGISQKKVEDLINTNPLEFMLNFSKGLKGMDATETAKTLDYLGINADGANKAIGAMANNTGRFRELIDLSNKSFADGVSLVNEYDIKNNNLAATLEKLKKTVSGWFSSETFTGWLLACVNLFSRLVGSTEEADDKTQVWKNTLVFTAKVIAVVTAALVTNVAWQKLIALVTNRSTEANLLYMIGQKAKAVGEGIAIVATQAYAAVTMLLTGNVRGATQAFRIMTATMATTPWGFILTAISGIIVAYKMFSSEAEKAITKQTMLKNIQLEATRGLNAEKNALNDLLFIANNEFESKQNRIKAIKQLNELSPQYLGNLTLENLKTTQAKKSIDAYVTSLKNLAYTKALQEKLSNIQGQKIDITTSSDDQNIGGFESFYNSFEGRGEQGRQKLIKKNKDAKLKPLGIEEKIVQDLINEDLAKNGKNYLNAEKDNNQDPFNIPQGKGDKNSTKKNPNSSDEEINRLKLDNANKSNDELLKLQRQLEDDRMAVMEEGYQKELAIENLRYEREIQDLEKQRVHADQIIKLDEDIAKAREAGDTKKANALLVIKEEWGKQNKKLDEKISEIEENKYTLHNIKLGTIEEKAAKNAIEKSKEQFENEKVLRQSKFNEELLALGENQTAREKLKNEFDENELKIQAKFLESLIDKFKTITGKENFEGIDLKLLTAEQVAEFQKEADKVGLTLTELLNKLNEVKGAGLTNNAKALGITGNADIFGFTPDNWVTLFDNLGKGKLGIDEMVFAVSALTNMFSQYNDFVTANENNQLRRFEKGSEAKKRKLKQQLSQGYINHVEYKVGVENIDKDLDRKKAEIEYNQAKRQKIVAAMNVVTSTAQAMISVWAQVPKFDGGIMAGILTGIVGTIGALQLATVLRAPLPVKGYEQGLYPEYVQREQDKKTFKASFGGKTRSGMVKTPTYFLAGEGNKPEMIIDNAAWRKMDPSLKDALIRNIQQVKGFETGYYKDNVMFSGSASSQTNPPASNNNDALMQMMIVAYQENTAVLKDLRENGLEGKFYDKDLESMKKLKKGIQKYDDLVSKNKR